MDKLSKKRNNYNEEILNELIKKYGFKKNYIQKAIRGERTGTIPLKIKEEYKTLTAAANIAIHSKINSI
jgi:phosphoserine aminotransferase